MLRQIRNSRNMATAPRDDQHRHGWPDHSGCGGDRRNQQWPRDGAELIKCFVYAEPRPSPTAAAACASNAVLAGPAVTLGCPS